MKKTKWIIMLAIVCLANIAWAGDYRWNNFSGSADWTDPANWILTDGTYNGQVPGPGDTAKTAGDPVDWTNVDYRPVDTNDIWGYDLGSENNGAFIVQAQSYYNWTPQTININADDDITCYRWRGGNGGHYSNATLNIYGSLTTTGKIEVERSHYSSVVINQYDGSSVSANGMEIGYKSYRAIYNMYGGTLTTTSLTIPSSQSGYAMSDNIGALPTADGEDCYTLAKAELNIYDGDVYTDALSLNYLSSPSGKINILNGTLYILGDKRIFLDMLYLPNNAILPIEPQDHIAYYYDGAYTIVTAIPEPVTILLMGIGSTIMMRRQKNRLEK